MFINLSGGYSEIDRERVIELSAMTKLPNPPTVAGPSHPDLSALSKVVAVIAIGQAMTWAGRTFSWASLAWATVALFAMAAAVALRPGTGGSRVVSRLYQAAIVIGVTLGLVQLPLVHQFVMVPQLRPVVTPFIEMAALAAILVSLVLFSRRRGLVLAGFIVLLVVHAFMGLWYLHLSTAPKIDVYLIQRLGCDALVHGHNPYAITFPNIYGPNQYEYPPSSVVNGVVQCGYFYPPLSLVLDVPGYLLGDVRYSLWAMLTITYAILAWGPGRWRGANHPYAPIILLMFLPGLFKLMENAWIEPALLLMLAVATVAAKRGRWILAAVAIGLLLSAKQYALMAAPAVWLLLPRLQPWRHLPAWAAVIALSGLAITSPFILWNPHAFFHSLISIYVGILRPDSITYLPMLSKLIGARLSLGATMLLVLPAIALVLWRAPRSPTGFATGAALIWTCTFIFSTQAFGNYYFLAAGALCAALVLGANDVPVPVRRGVHPDIPETPDAGLGQPAAL